MRLRQPDQRPAACGHVEDPLGPGRSQVGERGEDDGRVHRPHILPYAPYTAGMPQQPPEQPPRPGASGVSRTPLLCFNPRNDPAAEPLRGLKQSKGRSGE
ncbi:hypothetical protein GCM10009541_31210 [Micromonospora gifhornensis]|uniref:Uncharacterized protein n=1 Tax=Micromonospora gifhornensis TaxID=84594 RepID=A0ABQ4IG38_9ACTN|nr:hypothetical protein Vgi01_35210 [Micromonospora gifhornensis]